MSAQDSYKKVFLDPQNSPFEVIMGNGRSYIVPPFQRDYSWEREEWEDLWEDIQTTQSGRQQHFMGYLVLKTADGKEFEIIDGQQRLTTLTIIILAAMRRLQNLADKGITPKDNEERKAYLEERYLHEKNISTLEQQPKLTLNRHNKRHFRNLMQHQNITPDLKREPLATNRKINKAFEYYIERLNQFETGIDIADIIRTVAEGLLFTTITVRDDLDAYKVFETLNARGIHLSASDLLKNHLLSILAKDSGALESAFENFQEEWAGIIEQLRETDFTNFLRAHMGMTETLPQKREIFRRLKDHINAPKTVMDYLYSIKRHAAVYAALQNEHDPLWNESGYHKAKKPLHFLNLFNIKTPLSVLMATYEKLSPEDFTALLNQISVCALRYNVICNNAASKQETIFNKIAQDLMKEKITLKQATQKLTDVYPKDAVFKSNFGSKIMPSRQSNKRIVYILSEIERHLMGSRGKSAMDSYHNVSLEHVLPYNPDDEWQEAFGRVNYENAKDRLGNMALLSEASNMAQQPFDKKKEILRNSGFRINEKISKFDHWDMENLDKHQKWLANQAASVWRISQLEGND